MAPLKVSIKKSFQPTQQLTILGYHYDTTTQTVSIPKIKIQKIITQLYKISNQYKCQAVSLLSIVGKLRWVSNIISYGNAFVRRIEQIAHSVKKKNFWVKITKEARKDIKWWLDILNNETKN